MRGRVWLILGAAVGVAIGFAHVGQLADPARSLANGAEQAVGSGGHRLADLGGRSRRPTDGR